MGLDCQWLPQAHQNSAQPGYAPQSWCTLVSTSHPSCSAGSTVVWATGKGLWGECSGCFLSFPHEHQQLGMWDSRLWGPLALLCSFPCYQNGRWRLCSCREGGRKVQLLWGRSNPIFLTQGPRAGLGRVLVLGLVLALRTTCTSVCSCCAPWICPPKAVWGDASVLLPAQTFPPLLGRDGTSPGNLHNSRVAGEGQP